MLLIFDVLGTLFSLDAVKNRFQAKQIPEWIMELWFAKLLQSVMACTLARKYVPFRALAEATLTQVLARHQFDGQTVEQLLAGLEEVRPWPDAPACVRALRGRGHRLTALTNTGTGQVEGLLERWGLKKEFELVFSSDMVKHCKPHPAPYEMVLSQTLTGPYDSCMISAHAWDILGAQAIGMNTVYVSRLETQWMFPGSPAGLVVPVLADVPAVLSRQFTSHPGQAA